MLSAYNTGAPRPTGIVTALVPAYNSATFVGDMLASLADQTYPNLEILISDDGSTDDTIAVCEKFAAGREDVTVVAQEKNLGWVGNSNYLLESAAGEFVLFAFHDDVLAPTYVEELVGAMQSHPEAAVAFSDMTIEHSGGRKAYFKFDLLDGLDDPTERARIMISSPGDWWVPFRGLVRRSVYMEAGGLRCHRAGEVKSDWLWLLALSLRGSFVRVPKLLYTKRKRSDGVSSAWNRGLHNRTVLLFEGIREILRSELTVSEKVGLVVFALFLRVPGLRRFFPKPAKSPVTGSPT